MIEFIGKALSNIAWYGVLLAAICLASSLVHSGLAAFIVGYCVTWVWIEVKAVAQDG